MGHQFASGDEAIRVRSAQQTTNPAFTPGIGVTPDHNPGAAIGGFIAKTYQFAREVRFRGATGQIPITCKGPFPGLSARRELWRDLGWVYGLPPGRDYAVTAAGKPSSIGKFSSRDHSFQDPKYTRMSFTPISLSAMKVTDVRAPLKQ